MLGLEELLQRRPGQLSGGQRQRVAMGRALVREPDVFLLDEPLSNLDAKLRVQMRAELKRLQARLGVTTIYVTHDQVEAMTLGERIAVLSDGVLQQVGRPQEVYDDPDNVFVAGFIGSPPMNLLRGTGDERAGRRGGPRVRSPAGGRRRRPRGDPSRGRSVRSDGITPARLRGPVEVVEPLGDEVLVHGSVEARDAGVRIGAEEATLLADTDTDRGTVTVRLPPEERPGGRIATRRRAGAGRRPPVRRDERSRDPAGLTLVQSEAVARARAPRPCVGWASTPPSARVERRAARVRDRQGALEGSPASHEQRNPASKLSPAPVVSTGTAGGGRRTSSVASGGDGSLGAQPWRRRACRERPGAARLRRRSAAPRCARASLAFGRNTSVRVRSLRERRRSTPPTDPSSDRSRWWPRGRVPRRRAAGTSWARRRCRKNELTWTCRGGRQQRSGSMASARRSHDRPLVGEDRAVVGTREHDGQPRRAVRGRRRARHVHPAAVELVAHAATEVVVPDDPAERDRESEAGGAAGDDRPRAADREVRPRRRAAPSARTPAPRRPQHQIGLRRRGSRGRSGAPSWRLRLSLEGLGGGIRMRLPPAGVLYPLGLGRLSIPEL